MVFHPSDFSATEFSSRLFIGTAPSKEDKCQFNGKYSRQYVGLTDPEDFKLYAKRKIKIKGILSCFEMAEPKSLIQDAVFNQAVLAYNSKATGKNTFENSLRF